MAAELKNVRLVVFDCDGTLVDSQHSIVSAMTQAWERHDLPPPPPAAVRTVVGLPLAEAIAVLAETLGHMDAPVAELTEAYRMASRADAARGGGNDPLYPGTQTVLSALDRAGILMGVATGKGRRGLGMTLEQHRITDRFVTLKTADDGPGKPNPHILNDAMAEAGVEAEETLMIGDTTFDMKMASAARVRAIGVSWGYHSPDALLQTGAERVIDRFEELLELLELA